MRAADQPPPTTQGHDPVRGAFLLVVVLLQVRLVRRRTAAGRQP